MPYDSTKPVNGTLVDADFLRGQFNSLKGITDTLGANTFTSVVVDAVNTVPAGQPANVTVNVIGNTLHLTFDIPQGGQGNSGNDGGPGPQGADGPPGEVTNAALTAAITGTSSNSNAVAILGLAASPAYDAGQLQAVINRLDDLLMALRR